MVSIQRDVMNKSGIYKITNIIKNKYYIGSSINLKSRKYKHFKDLERNIHCNKKLQNSYNKHGSINFVFEIIEEVEYSEDKKLFKKNLLEREQYWIDEFNTVNEGYNINPLAMSRLGSTISEEHKELLRKVNKGNKYNLGRKASEETRNKMSKSASAKSDDVKRRISNTLKGHKVSEETRKILIERNTGRIISEETRIKLRESHLGNKHTEEAKLKIGEAHKNKIVSKETRDKMSKLKKGNTNMLGKTHSEETKKKISDASKISCRGRKQSKETVAKRVKSREGYKHSEETKQRMRESAKSRKKSEESTL